MTTKLRAASFQDNAVTTAKIAADAITNAKIADDAVQAENVASTVNLGRRNIIINGAMQVAQRGTSLSGLGATHAGYTTLDRYATYAGADATAGRYTMSQSTVTDLEGFSNALKIDCTTADTSIAAGEALLIQHAVEGFNVQQLKATSTTTRAFTLSFYAKSNASRAIATEINLTNGTNRSASKIHTIGTSWARYTFTIPAASSTQIDNDNSSELQVNFWLHAGSTYSSGTMSASLAPITNANRAAGIGSIFASTDNEIEITGVQLEVGEQATPFEHRPIGEELALCQRYFFQINGTGTEYNTMSSGQMYTTTTYLGYFQTPVPMRAKPSFSLNNSLSTTNFSVVTGGAVRAISGVTPTGDNQYLRINASLTSSGTQGHGGYVQLQNGYNALWSAEI